MKLGIACVYFYGEEDSWMLDLQLREIARHTEGYDFTVYAAANRLWPSLKEKLSACDFVEILDLPETGLKGGPEHGAYLDALVRHAAADGCSHICTLDCDSFPVKADWPALLEGQLGGGRRLAAVLRLENLDTCLPHPSGYFMEASFVADHDPVFWPGEDRVATPDFQQFLQDTGERIDTGIGYAYSLWTSGEDWTKLPRSNKRDLHFLMAGIYGDVFFPRLSAPPPAPLQRSHRQAAHHLADRQILQ